MMELRTLIAIDGPSASGKSSVARVWRKSWALSMWIRVRCIGGDVAGVAVGCGWVG